VNDSIRTGKNALGTQRAHTFNCYTLSIANGNGSLGRVRRGGTVVGLGCVGCRAKADGCIFTVEQANGHLNRIHVDVAIAAYSIANTFDW
jgi:hypothetical protein